MIAGLLMGAMKLAGSWINNKDKKEELATQVVMKMLDIADKAIAVQTVPWVDATVKLVAMAYTFMRPLGGAIMTGLGIYFHYLTATGGMEALPDVVQYGLDAAFPTWGVAREVDKKRKAAEAAPRRTDVRDLFGDN
jgi:hypothetical protein